MDSNGLVALTLPLSLAVVLAACSGEGDAPPKEPETPALVPHHYVVSEASFPADSVQARQLGLDLNADGQVDNRMGQLLAALAARGVGLQGAQSAALSHGTSIVLLDLELESFVYGAGALSLTEGDPASATPPACTSAEDAQCGAHLQGTGSFKPAAWSAPPPALAGSVASGTFTGGPGGLSFPLVLGLDDALPMELQGARVQVSGMSEAGLESVITAGAMTKRDVDTLLVPALVKELAWVVMRDCVGGSPPGCGCLADSAGKALLGQFEVAPADCTVTQAELASNAVTGPLLEPDLTVAGQPALSFGMKLKAVKASF